MPLIAGTVVTSGLSPGNSLNTHETHRAFYGKGGYRTVDTTTTRNQITPLRREEGMLVYVVADQIVYQLKPGYPLVGNTTDSDWQIFSTGSPTATVITGSILPGANYDLIIGQTSTFTITEYLLNLKSASKSYGSKVLISKDHTNTVVPGFSLVEYAYLGDILYTIGLTISGADIILRITNNELVNITYTLKPW
jgi:hypothetical protein